MDSSCTSLVLSSPLNFSNDFIKDVVIFDSTKLHQQSNLPTQFLWPVEDLVHREDELREPLVDLQGFFNGDSDATAAAAHLIRVACQNHGFFQVINHGVDMGLVQDAYRYMDAFFNLPVSRKVVAGRESGSLCGYSGAHADRFSAKLPWKETFSFTYQYGNGENQKHNDVIHYFKTVLGDDFEQTGLVYKQYCEAMEKLSLGIMELLGISLGLESKEYYREFYEDGNSLMRCNYYPPCKEYGLTLGTGPHCDPTSLTILHQDQVGGLEVFANNKWQAVRPKPDAFVINIGDTFMALSNGRYKSCLHRAVVNREKVRRSLVFFVCPKEDKVIKPPKDLIYKEGVKRVYKDFKWSDLLEFTQKHYRADVSTLDNFFHWFLPTKP